MDAGDEDEVCTVVTEANARRCSPTRASVLEHRSKMPPFALGSGGVSGLKPSYYRSGDGGRALGCTPIASLAVHPTGASA
uniref:Uncharacterized protein n=1 Tax=Arundo donax TaxID=35708 RepID=A0A0A9A816_ARUDO